MEAEALSLLAEDRQVQLVVGPSHAAKLPPGLSPGARVLVADTGLANAAASAANQPAVPAGATLVPSATVIEVDPPTDTQDTTVISLRVPAGSATDLATAAAAERASLILLPPSGP